ncbi:MAG: metallophosphoesterase [bacterium]|nr:metallophosphoesterase [bacterium]
MLIGVMSDSHDRLPAIDAALALFARRNVEAVIHAGDIVAPFAARRLAGISVPLHICYGNNDGERAGLQEVLPQIQDGPLRLELDGTTVLVHHFIGWCDDADVQAGDVVIAGHTHEVVNDSHGGRLALNPGECCGWVTGRCTVAVLDTRERSAEICELKAT